MHVASRRRLQQDANFSEVISSFVCVSHGLGRGCDGAAEAERLNASVRLSASIFRIGT